MQQREAEKKHKKFIAYLSRDEGHWSTWTWKSIVFIKRDKEPALIKHSNHLNADVSPTSTVKLLSNAALVHSRRCGNFLVEYTSEDEASSGAEKGTQV